MAKEMHCSVCGFIMLMEIQGNDVTYTCVNSQHEVGEAQGVHMSEDMVNAYKSLGTNVDILMEFLKRP